MQRELDWMSHKFLHHPVGFFLSLVATQLILWTSLPALTFQSFPLDVTENLGWGREWQLGYYKHPPLQAWLSEAMALVTGTSIWGQLLLSQLMVALSYLGIWLLARDIVGVKGATYAVLLTSMIYFFNYPTTEFNANILNMAIWPWVFLFFWKALDTKKYIWWILLALVLALDFYAKYTTVILVVSLGLIMLALKQGRVLLATPGPWIAGILYALLISPNLYWLVTHDWMPLEYIKKRSTQLGNLELAKNIAGFVGAQIAHHAALLLLLLILGARLSWSDKSTDLIRRFYARNKFSRRYVLLIAVLPITLTILYALINGSKMKEAWAAPMFVTSGLLAATFLNQAFENERLKHGLRTWLVLFILLPIVVAALPHIQAALGQSTGKVGHPGPTISKRANEAWAKETGAPFRIVAAQYWPASMIAAFQPRQTSIFHQGNFRLNPWITEERLQKQGALFIWAPKKAASKLAPSWAKPYEPNFSKLGSFSVKLLGGKKKVYQWAILPPGKYTPKIQSVD